MKAVKRWRYDCDFCKKTGGSKFHMKNHEEICTANPDRKCGFCKIMEKDQSDLVELKNIITKSMVVVECTGFDGVRYNWNEWPGDQAYELEKIVLSELREKANNCPACILSSIRQTNTTGLFQSFDFKKEKTEMFNECQPTDPEYYY